MSHSKTELTPQNQSQELQELLIRREQQAFDRLQKIVDNCDALQKQLQDANRTIETTTMDCLDLRSRQQLAIDRMRILRRSLL